MLNNKICKKIQLLYNKIIKERDEFDPVFEQETGRKKYDLALLYSKGILIKIDDLKIEMEMQSFITERQFLMACEKVPEIIDENHNYKNQAISIFDAEPIDVSIATDEENLEWIKSDKELDEACEKLRIKRIPYKLTHDYGSHIILVNPQDVEKAKKVLNQN